MIRLLPKKPSFTFLGWAIAFVLVRLLILLSAPLEIYDPEEMFNGTAARELLRGMKLLGFRNTCTFRMRAVRW